MSDQTFTSEECVNSTQHSIYTRRCFVTGELCSKQTNVHKEREKLFGSGGNRHAQVGKK